MKLKYYLCLNLTKNRKIFHKIKEEKMGIYISIVDDRGHVIQSNKYGVGFAALMFSDAEQNGSKVIMKATGTEAIANINRSLDFLRKNKTPQNDVGVSMIQLTLKEVRDRLSPERTYSCDWSEFFEGVNVNPEYDPMHLLQEWYDRMNDAIIGYEKYSFYRDTDCAEQAFRHALMDSLEIKNGVSLENYTENTVIYRIHVALSEGEKQLIKKQYIYNDSDDDHSYTNHFVRRKIYYAVKKEFGFAPESIMPCDCATFYVVFNRNDINKWDEGKPYVLCYYKIDTMCPAEFLVQNTPEEKEKFYLYASWKGATSIIIDGEEFCGREDDDIAESLGKELERFAYELEDIKMTLVH